MTAEESVDSVGVGMATTSIRVCMVSTGLPPFPSGAGLQALALAGQLKAREVDVWMLTGRYSDQPVVNEINGIVVRQARARGTRSGGGYVARISFIVTSMVNLIRYRREWDIVHIHGGYSDYIGCILAAVLLRRRSLIKVTTPGDDDIASFNKSRLGRLWSTVMRRASGYIALNQPIVSTLVGQGIGADRIHVIPNGVDTERFRPLQDHDAKRAVRRKLNLPEDQLLLISVGALVTRKGAHRMIPALAKAVSEGRDCSLALVGTDMYEMGYVEALRRDAMSSGVGDRVFFCGEQTDVAPFLQAADIFVQLSEQEGMSNAVLEAMSVGLPCIVTNLPGTGEVIDSGENGLLLPGKSLEDETTSAFLQLIDNVVERKRMGLAARERISRNFSLRAVADRYERLYTSLLSI